MLYLKCCPKCQGDLYEDRDAYGAFRQCFQCGLIQDLEEARMKMARAPAQVLKRVPSRRPVQKAVA